jgi:uncharacterized protein YcfJ
MMPRVAWLLTMLVLLSAAGLPAQASGSENVIYAYAQVLRADPVYERSLVTEQVERCNEDLAPRARDRFTRRGADEDAAALPGAGCQLVEEDREVNRLSGYDVEYRYRGDVFISRVPEDPGDRLRIRITVSPALDGGPR